MSEMDLSLLEDEERNNAPGVALNASQRVSEWINEGLAQTCHQIQTAPFVEDDGTVVLVVTCTGFGTAPSRRLDFRISKTGDELSVIAVDENAKAAQMKMGVKVRPVQLLLEWLLRPWPGGRLMIAE